MRYIKSILLGFLVGLIIGLIIYLRYRSQEEEVEVPKKKYLTLTDENKLETEPRQVAVKDRSTAVSKPAPDSLEAIRGIGPVYAQKLNAAGVTTFRELAASSDPQLEKIIGARAGIADFESWKEQARTFANSD